MKKQVFFSFIASAILVSSMGPGLTLEAQAAYLNQQDLQINQLASEPVDSQQQNLDLNLNLQANTGVTISTPKNGNLLQTETPFNIGGTCTGETVTVSQASFVSSPVKVDCENGKWLVEDMLWDISADEFEGGLDKYGEIIEYPYLEKKISAYSNNNQTPVSVTVKVEKGGFGEGGGCAIFAYQVWLDPCDEGSEGMGTGGGCFDENGEIPCDLNKLNLPDAPYGYFTNTIEPMDGKGRIKFSATVGDADLDPLKLNFRYVAINPGQECPATGYKDAHVVGPVKYGYTPVGSVPDLNNAGNTGSLNKNYQFGKTIPVPTDKGGKNTIDLSWDTHVDLPNKAGQACVMINANDGSTDQSVDKSHQERITDSEIIKVTYDNINPEPPVLTPVNNSFDQVVVQCETKAFNFISHVGLKKNPTFFLCGPGKQQINLDWMDTSADTLQAYQIDTFGNMSTVSTASLQAKPACSDGVDNDGDADIDKLDPGCWADKNDPNSYDPNDDNEFDGSSCADGEDNDKDGLIDKEDPGCYDENNNYDPTDDDETDPVKTACNDGVDNDSDGLIDEKDPGCWSDPNDSSTYDETDNDETDPVLPACSDGKDNDNDGKIDKEDPGCLDANNNYNPNDNSETDPVVQPKPSCSDGLDNDLDGKIDASDPGCWSDPNNPDTYNPNDSNEVDPVKTACDDGVDNDNDGLVDSKDPGCWTNPNDPDTYNPNDNNEYQLPTNQSAPEQTDEGSVIYDETQDPVANANRRCLEYVPTRNLSFTDINISDAGGKDAVLLGKTILRLGLQSGQYALSGYGSDAGNTGKATIGLEQPLTRLEWAKLLMITHCFSIFDTGSLPQVTYEGAPMPSYNDFPRGTRPGWESDIIYSASYYNIWNGTLENNIEYNRPIRISEAIKMLVRAGEFRQGFEYSMNPASVQAPVTPSDWFYEFYAKTPNLSHLNNPFLRADAVTIRNESFGFLLDALLTRSVYSEEDEALVKSLR